MAASAISGAQALGKLSPQARLDAPAGANGLNAATDSKLKKNARDFEAVFLEIMVDRMFNVLGEDGPLGGKGPGDEVWRSMLAQQHARSIGRSGGVGVAANVYDELVKIQARASAPAAS